MIRRLALGAVVFLTVLALQAEIRDSDLVYQMENTNVK